MITRQQNGNGKNRRYPDYRGTAAPDNALPENPAWTDRYGKRTLNVLLTAAICIVMTAGPLYPTGPAPQTIPPAQRLVINLNSHWLFKSGDIPNGWSDTLNETGFQPVCLPHTTTIVSHRDIDMRSFWKISWYRRHFTPSAKYQGNRFYLEFQGASQVTEVFVNGTWVGMHQGAYTPFSFDITDQIRLGADNVIAVRVDSRKHRGIPPEGITIDYMLFGGITRDVSMLITNPLHCEWVFASRDSIDPNRVNVRVRVKNNDPAVRHCTVASKIIDSSGAVVTTGTAAASVGPNSSVEVAFATGPIKHPHLWHTEHPYLYTVRTGVQKDSAIVDECTETIGLRSISFSKIDGRFYINGRPLWLRGLNRHETFPFIGRAAANRLQVKDADILKYDLGCNIVRCSHYPQDPEFLKRCDEIGLLVLEEIPGWCFVGDTAWQRIALKNVEEMIMRDRNHPSVISYGVRVNESSDFHNLYEKTNSLAHALDPTRPTHGVRLKNRGSPSGFLEDIWAQNFVIPKGKPQPLPWLITECVGTGCQVRSWDPEQQLNKIMLRFAEVFDSVAANKYLAGALAWCAFDYNSSHGTADRSVCYYGAADIFRIPKQAGMFLRSQADPSVAGPMVYIAHYWIRLLFPNDVWVASNCEQVELFVNGTSVGKKIPDRYTSLSYPLAVWKNVRFKPGEIKAVGIINDTIVATHIRTTSGTPVALKILPDDTVLVEGGDMTRVVVTAVDKFGQTVPAAKNKVGFSVSGAADFVGMNPIALEDGKTAFFIKTRADETGAVMCMAESPGLAPASARLVVRDDPQAALRQKVLGR
jgi:beta-galactosidase